MSTLRCCHCGRRLRRAAGVIEQGPVGPVCAVKLGLPREVKPMRKAKANVLRVIRFVAPVEVDASQLALEFAA